MKHFHKKCKKHLYQIIQVELKDGSVYQGVLHSYDREKMYIIIAVVVAIDCVKTDQAAAF